MARGGAMRCIGHGSRCSAPTSVTVAPLLGNCERAIPPLDEGIRPVARVAWPPPPHLLAGDHVPAQASGACRSGAGCSTAPPAACRAARGWCTSVDVGLRAVRRCPCCCRAGPRWHCPALLVGGHPPAWASGAVDRRFRDGRAAARSFSSPTTPRGSTVPCWVAGSRPVSYRSWSWGVGRLSARSPGSDAPCSSRASATRPGGSGTCCASGTCRRRQPAAVSGKARRPMDGAFFRFEVSFSRWPEGAPDPPLIQAGLGGVQPAGWSADRSEGRRYYFLVQRHGPGIALPALRRPRVGCAWRSCFTRRSIRARFAGRRGAVAHAVWQAVADGASTLRQNRPVEVAAAADVVVEPAYA